MKNELGVLFLCDFQPLVCEDSLVVRLTYILGSDDRLKASSSVRRALPASLRGICFHLFSSNI